MHHLSLICLFALFVGCLATETKKTRYSVCLADRGYMREDGLKALQYLSQNVTFEKGLFMPKNECVYARENTTVFSLCNGNGRNRTVTQNEVRRGAEQLIKDCGQDGPFNGYHVVNNLTFAAYGVHAGKNIDFTPQQSNPSPLPTKRQLDPCTAGIGYNGEPRTNCGRQPGHDIDPATGVCGNPKDPATGCTAYCETRRSGLLGFESDGPGDVISRGQGGTLTHTQEITVTNGFSFGLEGTFKEAIAASVTYEFSLSKTKGHGISREEQAPPNWDARFVFFPILVETCGMVSRTEVIGGGSCSGSWCEGGEITSQTTCGEEVETKEICAMTPQFNSLGEPAVYWAMRYEDTKSGTVAPIDEQPADYQNICQPQNGKGDVDGREYSCKVPQKPAQRRARWIYHDE